MNNENELEQYKQQLYYDYSSTQEVRERANEEYRFVVVAGAQWESWLDDAYQDRAKPELNHVSAFCRRVYSRWTNNRQTVNFSPDDDSTQESDADLLDGLFRRDMRNGGDAAVDTAVWEAIASGFGAVIFNTTFEDDGDPENENQNILLTEQPNAYNTVFFDSGARRADKADAQHVTVLTPYTKKAYEKKWPDADISSIQMSNDSQFNWYNKSSDLVYVATRYEKVDELIELHSFANDNGEVTRIKREELEDSQSELDLMGFKFIRSRKLKKKTIYKTTFSGQDILDKRTRIIGEYLPVIPFYGYRHYVDGCENFNGVARENMDGQRIINMLFGMASETAAYSSNDKPIFSPDQMRNPLVQQQWQGNVSQQPYLLADSIKDASGNPIHHGPTGLLPGGSVSPVVSQLVQMTNESMQASMGGAPQDIADPQASGKAINAINKRIDMNTDMVDANRISSITHMGVVYQSMAREVYGGAHNANRSVRLVTDDGQSKPEKLVKAGVLNGQISAVNDLSKGRFQVVAGVSPDYKTENEETFEALKDIVGLIPPNDPWRSDLAKSLFLLKEGGGLKDMQGAVRRELMAKGLITPESDEDIQYMQQLQEQQQNQQQDPNDLLIQAAAAEQETQARLNEAKIADTSASAVKKAAEAEQIKIESSNIVRESRATLN